MVALACCLLTPFTPTALAAEVHEIPLVMVVVGFDGGPDQAAGVPYDNDFNWSASLFGEGESPASYYRDMSASSFAFSPVAETSAYGIDGNTNIPDRENDGIVHITLHRPHGAWGPVNVDSASTEDFGQFVMEALKAAGAYVDFARYDTNGDSEIAENELAVCIGVAGYEGAVVEDYRRTDIPLTWSHAGYLSNIKLDRSINGLHFNTYIAIAERYWDEEGPIESATQEPLGTLYHELGHAIGLPDLYAVRTTEGPWESFVVGTLSLMDSGGWQYADDGAGMRNIPTALDAWSRYVLGWTTPTIVVHSGDYQVASQLSQGGYSQLIIPTSDPDQYFLIENRQPEGHDIGLSEEYDGTAGLVIWHIDNIMFRRYYDANLLNDANHHPGVVPENLNGEAELELTLYNRADDTPEARALAGVTVRVTSGPSRDMVVHVEMDDAAAARNALHLLDDSGRDRLSLTETGLLESYAALIAAAARP